MAGIPSPLARIAECDVLPPFSVIMPTMFLLSSLDIMDGVSSDKTIIVSNSAVIFIESSTPRSFLVSFFLNHEYLDFAPA